MNYIIHLLSSFEKNYSWLPLKAKPGWLE